MSGQILKKKKKKAFPVLCNIASKQEVTGECHEKQRGLPKLACGLSKAPLKGQKRTSLSICSDSRIFQHNCTGFPSAICREGKGKVCAASVNSALTPQSTFWPCPQQQTDPQQVLKSDLECMTYIWKAHLARIGCPPLTYGWGCSIPLLHHGFLTPQNPPPMQASRQMVA